MAPTAWGLLNASRVTAIIQQLQDVRLLPQQLRFLDRTPIVPAEDGDIMARFTGYVTIADIIADDQQAVVYTPNRIQLESTSIPNLKHGRPMTQAMLNMLSALNRHGIMDEGIFSNYLNRELDALLLGVRQRMEALIVAMAIDGLSYDRLGIIMNNVTWGMPSDLKVTPVTAWDNAGSATPVTDIWTVRRTAMVRYGQDYNRLTLSTAAFMYMIATTEFQNKAKVFLPVGIDYTNLSLADLTAQKNIAQNILGMEIEFYDGRYWYQNSDGSMTSAPYLPITKVVLSNTADDNNPTVSDFANGVVTETVVADLADTAMVGDFGGPTRGPVSYVVGNPSLNPPNLTMWGVGRGFPRKHRLQSTAVLTVGTFEDPIPATEPFV